MSECVGLHSALLLIISNALDVLIGLTHDVHASFLPKKRLLNFRCSVILALARLNYWRLLFIDAGCTGRLSVWHTGQHVDLCRSYDNEYSRCNSPTDFC